MRFVIYAVLATAFMTVAGCTTDDQTIDRRPQFDRNGNPNFDKRGRYIGCHGIGCRVDVPDDDDGDQSIDDRPQYDRQGEPNFDTQGNYQGCHGIGCEVDDPDDDDD